MIAELPDLWLPQVNALRLVTEAIANGEHRICLVLPTGGGKSRVCWELCRDWLHCGFPVAVYTNRNMLIDQLCDSARKFGLAYGIRSAEALSPTEMPSDEPLQICSIQTEERRTLKKKVWQPHPALRVIVDEAHLNCGDTMQAIADRHLSDGAALVGLTASPLDLGYMYTHLVIGGTMHELRSCGALVPARYFGCAEPDTRKLKGKALCDVSEQQIAKIYQPVMHKLVGNIMDEYKRLNPEQLPTLGFAPGVPESIWLCEQCCAAGIPSAHIDGTTCVYQGERIPTSTDVRREIQRASNAGEIKIVWNRFVLREGIDMPWIRHLILATIMTGLKTYLQSVGRGLRVFEGKKELIVQDHGGNWWRHGSVNSDRHWELGDTERIMQGERANRLREKAEPEPMRCPKCGLITLRGKCSCGWTVRNVVRPIIMESGKIIEMSSASMFPPRPTREEPNTLQVWKSCYFRAKNSKKGMTFEQAIGLFFMEQGYYPPRNLALMPKRSKDWLRHVKEVGRNWLI